jgi:hypothetical protein
MSTTLRSRRRTKTQDETAIASPGPFLPWPDIPAPGQTVDRSAGRRGIVVQQYPTESLDGPDNIRSVARRIGAMAETVARRLNAPGGSTSGCPTSATLLPQSLPQRPRTLSYVSLSFTRRLEGRLGG